MHETNKNMKKNLLLTLLCTITLVFSYSNTNGQTLIHYWNFNNDTGTYHYPTIPPIHSSYSIIDTNIAVMFYEAQYPGVSSTNPTYLDNTTGDTAVGGNLNARMGSAAGTCIRPRNPSDSMQLTFHIPSTGYKNLVIKFETERTTNGAQQQVFDYSVDSGMTYIQTGLSAIMDTPVVSPLWGLVTININDPNANNNHKLLFRMRFVNGSTNTSGNDRIDNFSVDGDIIPTSISNVANDNVCILYPNPAVDKINIYTSEGSKTISIFNIVGQNVFSTESSDNNVAVNISQLSTGVYYAIIRMNNGDKSYRVKFVKQ